MIRYLDISLSVSPELPIWPGVRKVEIYKNQDMGDGDAVTDSSMYLNLHTGTHIDAPSHFIIDGDTVDHIPIDILIGNVCVVRIPDSVIEISADILSGLNIPDNSERLLFHTANSRLWKDNQSEFYKDFTALTKDGAEWLTAKGIKLVGIDYLSIQRFSDGPEVHQILLSAGVVVVEGLNLSEVNAGSYQLYCLPLKLKGMEAAPARVVLGYNAG